MSQNVTYNGAFVRDLRNMLCSYIVFKGPFNVLTQ